MCHWTSAAHWIGLKKFKKGNKVEIFFISTCSQPPAKLWFNTKPSNFLQIKDFQIRHNVRVDLQVLNGSHALNSKHISFQAIKIFSSSYSELWTEANKMSYRYTPRRLSSFRSSCLLIDVLFCLRTALNWENRAHPALLYLTTANVKDGNYTQ